MKVNKVIARFSAAPSDPTELRRVARSLGSELSTERVETLSEFRASIACTPLHADAAPAADVHIDPVSYAAGYVDGMMDVTAEVESRVRAQERSTEVPEDMARGINLAIDLFRHAAAMPLSSEASLQALARVTVGDSQVAQAAVDLWIQAAQAAGLRSAPTHAPESPQAIPRAHAAAGSTRTQVPAELMLARERTARDNPPSAPRPTLRVVTEDGSPWPR